MRILSQGGMIDVPYEMTAIHATGTFIRMNMVGDTGKGSVIAEYNTPNKAKKAMEMLRKAYAGLPIVMQNVEISEDVAEMFEKLKKQGICIQTANDELPKVEYINNGYFQFPADDEVEVENE